jgi:kynurenine formamidase
MMRILVVCALALAACRPAPQAPEPQPFALPAGAVIDLSHSYDASTIFWPTARAFELATDSDGVTDNGFYYTANTFCMAEHGGTHIDAPVHFAEGKSTVAEIPLDRLMGPAVLINVAEHCAGNADYQVTVGDFEAWESQHGRLVDGSIVLLRTGFGSYWPDRVRYMGTDARGPEAVAELHFPGLHPSAAEWLVANRSIKSIGLDTPSIDYGQSTQFESHRVLFAAEIPAFENLANLDRLPAKDFVVIALPMKIAGGSGGPLRIVAISP